jgi:hypothetical protein
MVGSFFLAGVILKLRIYFCALFGTEAILLSMGLFLAACSIFNGSDGKVVMAYSSVVHMTVCGFVMG